MNKSLIFSGILALASFAMAGQTTEVIFSDSFDRTGSNDIDASSAGMSGIVASEMVYAENGDAAAVNEGLTNVESNQLHLADGPNMSVFYLDYNFINSEFTESGGMRIGMTIVSDDGTFTDNDRYCGFGIGNTLLECQTSGFDFNANGFRGRIGAWDGSSDIWIGWSPNNNGKIQVYKNGPTTQGGENYAIEGIELTGNNRLELELFFDDFNAGSEVTAYILWDSVVIGKESFNWDNTNENYLGINCRQNNAGFTVDDLKIDAIVNDRAQNESPASGSDNVDSGSLNLTWDAGQGVSIKECVVYATRGLDINGDPNMTGPDVIVKEELITGEPLELPISVDLDQTIYWWVDEITNSNETIKGELWSFETKRSVPEIITQPVNQADFEDTYASLSVELTSISTPKVIWYKSIDNSNATFDDDQPVTELTSDLTTLAFNSVSRENEGYYYCISTNEENLTLENVDSYTVSNPAHLTVKRMVLYWDMETTEFLDMSNNGHDAIKNEIDTTDPNALLPTLSEDVPGAVGSHSAKFAIKENGDYNRLTSSLDLNLDGDDTTIEPQRFHEGYTLSFWAKPNNSDQDGLTGLFNNEGGTDDFQISFYAGGEEPMIAYHNDTTWPFGPATTEWFHVAIVCDGTTTTAYYNLHGPDKVSMNVANTLFGVFRVGCNRSTLLPYKGLIDDVKIWNYGVDYEVLAQDYFDVMDTSVCKESPTLDVSGNCIVDVEDLAKLAEYWLECNLYPAIECH